MVIIHWDEVRRYGKRFLAWTLFAVIVAPFFVLIGAASFALAASQAQHLIGAHASEFVGIVAVSVAVLATLQALFWWTKRYGCTADPVSHSQERQRCGRYVGSARMAMRTSSNSIADQEKMMCIIRPAAREGTSV